MTMQKTEFAGGEKGGEDTDIWSSRLRQRTPAQSTQSHRRTTSSSSSDSESSDLPQVALHQAQAAAHYALHQADHLLDTLDHAFAQSLLHVRDKYRHALKIYKFDQVPRYLQDNEFIHEGYRMAYSAKEAWLSVVHLHNETGNIWTHLIALVLFVWLLVAYGWFLPEHSDMWDYAIFAVFLLSAINCFLFSTLFHIHYCNSREAFQTFGCFDYAGISLLIAGSTAVVTYYSYYCHDVHRRVWLTILAGISFVGLVGPMFKIWTTDRFRVWRTGIYLASGVLSAVPALQYVIQHGIPDLPGMGMYGWIIMASCYIVGAMIYAFKIPECLLPGKFDYLFHSHQFWHIAVMFGAYIHYRSCMDLVHWRLNHGQCDVMHPELSDFGRLTA